MIKIAPQTFVTNVTRYLLDCEMPKQERHYLILLADRVRFHYIHGEVRGFEVPDDKHFLVRFISPEGYTEQYILTKQEFEHFLAGGAQIDV